MDNKRKWMVSVHVCVVSNNSLRSREIGPQARYFIFILPVRFLMCFVERRSLHPIYLGVFSRRTFESRKEESYSNLLINKNNIQNSHIRILSKEPFTSLYDLESYLNLAKCGCSNYIFQHY